MKCFNIRPNCIRITIQTYVNFVSVVGEVLGFVLLCLYGLEIIATWIAAKYHDLVPASKQRNKIKVNV